jgi:hypothetical protein
MSQRTLKLHGGLTAMCLALAATIAGCLGDDSSTTPPANDSGSDHQVGTGGSTGTGGEATGTGGVGTGGSTGTGGVGTGGMMGTGGGTGGATMDAAPDNRAPDAGRDATLDTLTPIDATPDRSMTPDAAPDVTVDARPDVTEASVDVATGDGNDGAIAPMASMCLQLDDMFGIATDAGGCANQTGDNCPDRADGGWGAAFQQDYFFSTNVQTDCHISNMFMDPNVDGANYFINFTAWAVAFFGCPDPNSAYPTRIFGLVPPGLENHVFTTADLQLLSSYWEQAIALTLSDSGLPPFTTDQNAAIHTELQRLSAMLQPESSNRYTFDACPADGGAD